LNFKEIKDSLVSFTFSCAFLQVKGDKNQKQKTKKQ